MLTVLHHGGLQKPPPGPLKLDLGHPLSSKLAFAPIFNENGGTTVHDHAGHLTLTFGTSVSWVVSPGGGAMNFSGSSGQYANGTIANLSNGSPWMFSSKHMVPTDVNHYYFDMGRSVTDGLLHTGPYFGNQGFEIDLFSDDRELDYTAPSGKNLGIWTHVHIGQTADKVISVYLNGVLQATSTAAGMYLGDTGAFTLGARSQGTTDLFIGAIEHFMFWNRALSPVEIRNHVLEPYAMFQARPIQRWISVGAPVATLTPKVTREKDPWGSARLWTAIR